MPITIIPKTRLGKWSAALLGMLILFFAVMMALVALGETGGGGNEPLNLKLLVPGILAGASGIAAFITGIIAIVKGRERSPLVFVSAFTGMMVLWFVIGEIIAPH